MAASPLSVFRTSNFAPAFLFLPAPRRRALSAVYAFAREVDDIVDEGFDPAEAERKLEAWRAALNGGPAGGINRPAWEALRAALADYSIPPRHLLDLVDGVARDLRQRRCETFEDLETYCRGVASTVGLACLPVFGLEEAPHRDFAVNLGVAVQLTNILRDVADDATRDHIYLPQEDMGRFDYTEEELKRSAYNDRFVRLMAFEAQRARLRYRKALESLPPESRRLARPALAMGNIYRALLEKLEKIRFRVFEGRVRLTGLEKLVCLAKSGLGG